MTVSFIGAGNIASHYAKELFEAGCKIDSILSKRLRSAKSLASIVNAHATTSFRNLSRDSNYYILAVPDEIIEKVTIALAEYVNSDAIIIHTSGATELKTILTHFKHAGFAWPPQSISKESTRYVQHSRRIGCILRFISRLCWGAEHGTVFSDYKHLTTHQHRIQRIILPHAPPLTSSGRKDFRVLRDMVCVPAVIIANKEHVDCNSPAGLSMTCGSHEKHLGHINIIPCAWDSIFYTGSMGARMFLCMVLHPPILRLRVAQHFACTDQHHAQLTKS